MILAGKFAGPHLARRPPVSAQVIVVVVGDPGQWATWCVLGIKTFLQSVAAPQRPFQDCQCIDLAVANDPALPAGDDAFSGVPRRPALKALNKLRPYRNAKLTVEPRGRDRKPVCREQPQEPSTHGVRERQFLSTMGTESDEPQHSVDDFPSADAVGAEIGNAGEQRIRTGRPFS